MSAKKVWWLLLIVVGVPVVALAWWLGSPLFLDRAVDEEFPRAAGATVPSNLTLPEVEQVLSAMAKVQQPVEEAMPTAAAPQPVKRGQFRDADSFHLGSGRATIYRLDSGGHLLRLEDFQVTNGPDLRVLLSRSRSSRIPRRPAGYWVHRDRASQGKRWRSELSPAGQRKDRRAAERRDLL